jgi:hypothetical protein
MSLIEIAKWNYDRNDLECDFELEENMFDEEAYEFKIALKDYLRDDNLFKQTAVVDMIDAYCDCNFVHSGSIAKAINNFMYLNVEDREKQMIYMNTFIIEALVRHGVKVYDKKGKSIIDYAMGYVIEANKNKPKDKTKNKVEKGKDWVDPKKRIEELLDERGFNSDVAEVKRLREQEKTTKTVPGTLEAFNELEGEEDE